MTMPTMTDITVTEAVAPAALSDLNQLNQLYHQAQTELDTVDADLLAITQQLEVLTQQHQELCQRQHRLRTLTHSLAPLIQPSQGAAPVAPLPKPFKGKTSVTPAAAKPLPPNPTGTLFLAEAAFHQVNQRLRQRESINYEMFRAIVYAGGRASTEQIRAYLVEQHICQPATGEGFAQVPLADISARVNYLVKKGIVSIEQRGVFKSVYGWTTEGLPT
jgi:hypothetical protein